MRRTPSELSKKLATVSKIAAAKGQFYTSYKLAELSSTISKMASNYYFEVDPGGAGMIPDKEYKEFDSEEEVIAYAQKMVPDKSIHTFEDARAWLLNAGSFGEMKTPLTPEFDTELEIEDPVDEEEGNTRPPIPDTQEEVEPAPDAESEPEPTPQEDPQETLRRLVQQRMTSSSTRTAAVEGLSTEKLQELRDIKRSESLVLRDLREMYDIGVTDLFGGQEPGPIQPADYIEQTEGAQDDQLEVLLDTVNSLIKSGLPLVKKIFPRIPVRGDLPVRAVSKALKKFGQDL